MSQQTMNRSRKQGINAPLRAKSAGVSLIAVLSGTNADVYKIYSGVTYAAVIPPSTRKFVPVTNEDSSDARYNAA